MADPTLLSRVARVAPTRSKRSPQGSKPSSALTRDRGIEGGHVCWLAAPSLATIAAPEAGRTTNAKRRILVVDDNEDAAALLALLLERLGNTVQVAHDGPSALEIVDQFAPDLAVLDIGLPRMDGYELARTLRAHNHRDLPLVALTGYGQASDRALTSEAGFDAHLVKPVTLRALQAVIARFPGPLPTPAST